MASRLSTRTNMYDLSMEKNTNWFLQLDTHTSESKRKWMGNHLCFSVRVKTYHRPRKIADRATRNPAGHTSARSIPMLACAVSRQQKPVVHAQGRELGHIMDSASSTRSIYHLTVTRRVNNSCCTRTIGTDFEVI